MTFYVTSEKIPRDKGENIEENEEAEVSSRDQVIAEDTSRVPTAPGKPGKMTTVFPVLEKYWNIIILLKILEK